MTDRSVTHASFTLERVYAAPPAKVFAAFAEPDIKAQWFGGPEDWEPEEYEMDFRVRGRDTSRGGPRGGPVISFECLYYDIVPSERIVFSYDMQVGETRISVSLTTIELKPEGNATRLTFTEQGAFLDGFDDAGSREEGTRGLLDALGRVVEA